MSLCTADPDPTARLPAPPYTPAPPYHPPTLLHGQSPNPAAYGHGIAPAYPPPRQHPSADYGSPPSCAHQAEQSELKAFCLEDEVRLRIQKLNNEHSGHSQTLSFHFIYYLNIF